MKKSSMSLFSSSVQQVAELFAGIKNPKDMADLLEDMMTPQELIDLGDRILIIHELKQGTAQRDIADKLGISVTTVSRGSRILKFGTGGANKFIG